MYNENEKNVTIINQNIYLPMITVFAGFLQSSPGQFVALATANNANTTIRDNFMVSVFFDVSLPLLL